MIYRYKPQKKVEAYRYRFEELPPWFLEDDRIMQVITPSGEYLQIFTNYGLFRAMPGDYIVLGKGGEFYPCNYDLFHDNYEPIEDDNRE